jgi:hypothetical protein
MMTWRELDESDLPTCLEMQPMSIGDEIVGRQTALKVWKDLLRSPAFVARVIEAANGRILGFGSSLFVSPEFMDREMLNPRFGINSRIVASIASHESVALPYDQIARANAGAGLHTVFLSACWWKTSGPAEFAEMMRLSASSCSEALAGYRLRSAVVELTGEQARALESTHAGGWRLIRDFPEADRALTILTKEDSLTVTASIASTLFHYDEPVLGLRASDQQLLGVAQKGATDREVAVKLNLTVPAVKRRWLGVFARIEALKPHLFAKLAAGSDGKRGPQRRHRVLSYVREHPEELRPYAAGPKRRS